MSSKEWRLLPLEDCMEAIIDYRGKTPRKSSFGIPLITAKIVKGGRILEPTEFIPYEDYDERMQRGIPKAGDVVVTTEAPLGEVGQLDNRKLSVGQRLITLRGKIGLLDNTYLKYLMMSEFVQNQLLARATGTTVFGIKQAELRKIELVIPPLPTQRRIADILSALDDKIELNHQTNATLEAISQTIFKEWFVDFNFPDATGEMEESALGMIPKGWRVGKIKDFSANIQYGFTQSASPLEIGPHFLRITDIQNGQIDWSNVPYCEVDEKQAKKYRIQNFDIFIARTGASTGENVLVINPPNAVFASYLIRVQFLESPLAVYIGKLLRTSRYFEYIDSIKSGSAQPNANAQQLTDLEIVLPPTDVMDLYFSVVVELEKLKTEHQTESSTLATLRNTLLPKLMTREFEI